MRLLVLLLSAVIALSSCDSRPTNLTESSTPQAQAARTADLRARLKAITLADGISRAKADLIARCYFDANVGCGAYKGIRDGGAYWIVEGAFGFGGMPIEGFHIDKHSGRITAGSVESFRSDGSGGITSSHRAIGPSYASPLEIYP